MSKLERNTLNQHAYSRLRHLLLNGHLPSGAQLDERILAAQIGVSRTPLREAIGHLAKEGIVEYRPYRGNFVRTFTAKQVKDLYQVRKTLESLAMRLAIPKLSQEHITEIGKILEQVGDALARDDMDAYTEADRRFHAAILHVTGNETLIESLERLDAQIQVVRAMANRDPEVVERTAKERPLILAALTARDADAAAHLMEAHIDGVAKAVVAQIEKLEEDGLL